MPNEQTRFRLLVQELVDRISRWAEPHEWTTKTYPKKMRTADGQAYDVLALYLQRGPHRLLLDPVAHDAPDAEAVVDLYLMPTYDDVATLYFENGEWAIYYAFPPHAKDSPPAAETKAIPLSEESINMVLDAIAAHAEPSI